MPTNPLNDLIPPQHRKRVYAGLLLAGVVYAIWQAAAGDWTEFVGGLFAAFTGGLGASNTAPGEPVIPGVPITKDAREHKERKDRIRRRFNDIP